MSRKMLLTFVLAVVLGGGIGAGIHYFLGSGKDPLPSCIAGPGEICPSPDFALELKTLKRLGDEQRDLSEDPKVKRLVSLMDQQRGMAQRMQTEINQTLQANPGHQWDGQKEKFVPAPVAPASTPAPAPSPATATKK